MSEDPPVCALCGSDRLDAECFTADDTPICWPCEERRENKRLGYDVTKFLRPQPYYGPNDWRR